MLSVPLLLMGQSTYSGAVRLALHPEPWFALKFPRVPP